MMGGRMWVVFLMSSILYGAEQEVDRIAPERMSTPPPLQAEEVPEARAAGERAPINPPSIKQTYLQKKAEHTAKQRAARLSVNSHPYFSDEAQRRTKTFQRKFRNLFPSVKGNSQNPTL